MMPQKHTPLQSFPFDIRTVEKRCSYVNTISINLALIKSNGNSDVVNILDMYAKDRHFLANSAPEAGNVSNREKSGTSRNFPLMCKIMAETAPTRPILSPPAAPFLSAAFKGVFRATGHGSLLPAAAKVTKNAVQTCGLKIRPRPAHAALPFCVPRGRGKVKTTRKVELICFYPRCR